MIYFVALFSMLYNNTTLQQDAAFMKNGKKTGFGIALLSGGLDSILTVRVLLDQGLKVEALHFTSVFDTGTIDVAAVAEQLGVRLDVLDHTEDMIEAVRVPEFGYGTHLNPCIDCRVRMLRRAAVLAAGRGADFVATGEVVGQRPMSQFVPSLNRVEKASGLTGRLMRPLSALLLKPTIAEETGIVDRAGLLSISGRGRKEQLKLAERYGISMFLPAAGGCALTNAEYAAKARDLLERGGLDAGSAAMLKWGRHFRFDERIKVIIGRSEKDNAGLARCARPGDVVLTTLSPPGPVTVVASDGGADRSAPPREAVLEACRWTAAYTKAGDGETAEIEVYVCGSDRPPEIVRAFPAKRADFRARSVSLHASI